MVNGADGDARRGGNAFDDIGGKNGRVAGCGLLAVGGCGGGNGRLHRCMVVFAEAVGNGRNQSRQRFLFIYAINNQPNLAATFHAQRQHGDKTLGVGLLFAVLHANVRFILLGGIHKHLGRPRMQAGGVVNRQVMFFHNRLPFSR